MPEEALRLHGAAVTEEERKNRNPAIERIELKREDLRELHICDLEQFKVYILSGRSQAATMNYMGTVPTMNYMGTVPTMNYMGSADGWVGTGYHFHGPRANVNAILRSRPDGSGTLEDGAGVKITIYEYTGPDA
jgi:hypothetical protein